jgi:predicted transcriptional regulator
MRLIAWSYGELRASTHRSRPERLLASNVDGSQRRRHDMTRRPKGRSRIVENALARADALSGDSQDERELRESVERGLADADAGRLIPVDELMREFGIEEG